MPARAGVARIRARPGALETDGCAVIEPPLGLSKLDVIRAVVRRCAPHVLEATVVPAALFHGCLVTASLGAAYVAALGWTYAAVGRRLVRHRAIPPLRRSPSRRYLGAIARDART